jgi:hypothetical protein
MSDITILPNPFKMLDLEREKRMKVTDNKCNSCEDKIKEGFNTLKKNKTITEGMNNQTNEIWLFVGVLSGVSIILFYLGVFQFRSIEGITQYSSNIKVTAVQHFIHLLVFIGFAYMSLLLDLKKNNEDKYEKVNTFWAHPNVWIPIVAGLLMFILKILSGPSRQLGLTGYFENTIGHFIFWTSTYSDGGLNKWIRSDNFEALAIHNNELTNNFNPLMSIFNLENFKEKIEGMQIENENDDQINSSDFFVSLKHSDGDKTKEEFVNFIKDKVIIKRVSGEVTLLVITTLISTGILKSMYH